MYGTCGADQDDEDEDESRRRSRAPGWRRSGGPASLPAGARVSLNEDVTVERRDFVKLGGLGAGALALGPGRLAAVPDQELPAPIRALEERESPPPITEEERAGRRARAQELMDGHGLVAMFIEPGATLDYYSGVGWGRSERLFGMLLPRRGDAVIVCPAFEAERAETRMDGRFEILPWQEDESPYGLIGDALRGWGWRAGRVAVDETARYFVPVGLGKEAPSYGYESAAPVTHAMRGRKSDHELALMRFANEVTLAAYEAAFATLREGMTQRDLSQTISTAMARLGYRGYAMALIGEASAYPHGMDNPRPLREGDIVLVDGGIGVHGYRSDITRTVAYGEPSAEAVQVFELVRRAQARALEHARPGVTAGSVDEAARAVITAGGYGPGYRTFSHRLGHGIGLEGHEWPYLVKDSPVVLEPGMTFSDEPGIYQYGKFGVRLEDIMVITADGAELMTPPAKTLHETS